MKVEPVEIYSDATNAAVMRHPARKYPGVLVQGDTLASLVRALASVQSSIQHSEDAAACLADVHDKLNELLQHYKGVLSEHSIGLPFHE
jgi:hypothetical protein